MLSFKISNINFIIHKIRFSDHRYLFINCLGKTIKLGCQIITLKIVIGILKYNIINSIK